MGYSCKAYIIDRGVMGGGLGQKPKSSKKWFFGLSIAVGFERYVAVILKLSLRRL